MPVDNMFDTVDLDYIDSRLQPRKWRIIAICSAKRTSYNHPMHSARQLAYSLRSTHFCLFDLIDYNMGIPVL